MRSIRKAAKVWHCTAVLLTAGLFLLGPAWMCRGQQDLGDAVEDKVQAAISDPLQTAKNAAQMAVNVIQSESGPLVQ